MSDLNWLDNARMARFGAWIETLTPDQIDFGRAPATPPEQLVRLMQAVQDKSSSGQ